MKVMELRIVILLLLLLLTVSLSSGVSALKPTTDSGGSMRRSAATVTDRTGKREAFTRPLIGILSQFGGEGQPAPANSSYIAASYVKFVEAGGARAVPLLLDEPEDSLRAKFAAINGFLIPGGGASFEKDSLFRKTASLLLDMALAEFQRGEIFPVHGTCLGFQLLSVLLSDADQDIMSNFDSENYPSPLIFTDSKASKFSRFLSSFRPLLVKELAKSGIAFENHAHGVATADFYADASLSDFFDVLATADDRAGANYIAMVQAAHGEPVTATQFHPEKNAFEWVTTEDIDHSAEGVELMQTVANYFVAQARKSSHRPASFQQEQDLLIYNYAPTFTGRSIDTNSTHVESNFDQAYIFPRSTSS